MLSLVTGSGTTLTTLDLAGRQYTSSDFTATGDGNNGTLIELIAIWYQIDNGTPVALTGGDFERDRFGADRGFLHGCRDVSVGQRVGFNKIDNGVPTLMTSGDFGGTAARSSWLVRWLRHLYVVKRRRLDQDRQRYPRLDHWRLPAAVRPTRGLFGGDGTYTWSSRRGWTKIEM